MSEQKGNKKMVDAITPMEEDFAKWYTDIVKKAELMDYTNVRGCMVIQPYGFAIWENSVFWIRNLKNWDMRIFLCQCLFRKACCRRKKTM